MNFTFHWKFTYIVHVTFYALLVDFIISEYFFNSLIGIITFIFSFFIESALISQSNLTGEVPEQMPSHDEYSSLSIDQTYKFMAFFVLMNEIRTRKWYTFSSRLLITCELLVKSIALTLLAKKYLLSLLSYYRNVTQSLPK